MADKPVVTLSSDQLEIFPGKKVEIKASIENTGDRRGSYSIILEGIDPRWYTLSTQSIYLSPGDREELTITVKPPLISSGEAEKYTAILKVTSTTDPSIIVNVPIEMPVGSLLDFDLEISPEIRKGKKGSFSVSITNKSEHTTTYTLEGKDPFNACHYQFTRQNIEVLPGENVKVELLVSPKDKPFRGSVEVHRFKVVVTPHGSLPYQSKRVAAEFIYKPVLRTVPAFLLIVAVIVTAAVINGISSLNIDMTGTLPYYTVAINMDGKGTYSGAGTYEKGTLVTISVNTDPEWEFIEWTGNTEVLPNRFSRSNQIVVEGDYTLTAHVKPLVIPPTTITDLILYPDSPATLNYEDWVRFDFKYITNVDYTDPDQFDVFIVPRPLSNGSLTPGYLSEGSPIQAPWQSEGKGAFTINQQLGEVAVDQIRFQIINAGLDIVVYEFYFPVSYTFIQDDSFMQDDFMQSHE
ncbi:MAG: hypothetical protein JSV32_06065 [Dehalococcoidia bacterium]|nr:MAG: hypothetical protein JSV32_06065 [Dehalococcoidia bacterium]